MQIVEPQPQHSEPLRALYLAQVASAAHCRLAPSSSAFQAALLQQREGLEQCVALDGSGPRGWAALRRIVLDDAGSTAEALTALFFDDAAAGEALLSTLEQRAVQRGARALLAFPRTHHHCPLPAYNAGWDGLPDRLAPVTRVLARHSYTPYYREMHMSCELTRFVPQPRAAPADVDLVERFGGRREWLVARAADRDIGSCAFGTLDELADAPEAGKIGYIWGLGVDDAYQRRGIGRALLTRSLVRLYQRGCTTCWLTTGADNWRAQPLYLALGFEFVDSSGSYRKEAL